MRNRSSDVFSDDDLDAALEGVRARASDADETMVLERVSAMRVHLFGDRPTARAPRVVPIRRGRRGRYRRLVAAGVAGVTLLGGGAAVASGGLQRLARDAFALVVDGEPAPDAAQAQLRVTVQIPDGSGQYELWSAPTQKFLSDEVCVALVTAAPGDQFDNKKYIPESSCGRPADDPMVYGQRWTSTRTTDERMVTYGLIFDAAVVTLSDASGHTVRVPTTDGFFIAFAPTSPGHESTYTGLSYTDTSGAEHTIRAPFVPADEG